MSKQIVISILLALMLILGIFLLLYAAVGLIQNKKFFSSAPKDVQAVITDHPERFPGAHFLGWLLAVIAILMILASFLYGAYDGIRNAFKFWELFLRFLIILDIYKIWDMLFLDRYLLTRSHFFQHFYPEVEGTQGMVKSGFNNKSQFLKLFVFFPLISLALSVICRYIMMFIYVNV